jgi:subtilisin family serine protease
MRRIAVTLATLSLLAGQLIFAGTATGADPSRFTVTTLTPDSTYVGTKSTSGAIAKSDPALLGRTDSTRVNVMIKYDYDATASYAGGVGTLKATSPRVTGKALKANKDAVKAYEAYTANLSQKITSRARKAAPGLDVRFSYSTAYGGVEASVPANQIDALVRTEGVAAVQQDTLEQPLDDNTQFIGATAVWPSLGGSANAGSNVIVGVIDTGVWPEHPMLAPGSLGAPAGGLRGCEFGDGSDVAHLGPTFNCNNKLIGAYAKTATYMAVTGAGADEFCYNTTHVCSPRDPEGHGTHTTTTAAGDCVASAMLYGVERGPVCGIAPGARVIQYRVCLAGGCFGSDSVSAVQQAILDGVDVINFSISGGANPYSDAVELAFLDAVHAGISVNASAGNAGPGAATSDHGGPWTTTVGASTGPRSFLTTLHLTADGGATFDMVGNTLTNGITSPLPVVLAQTLPKAGGGLEDVLCQSPLAPGAATGMIVMCQRGTNARVDKGFNVLQGGAAGMILYNPVKMDVETDNHWLPAVHVDGPSTDLLAFVNGHTKVMGSWAQGTATPTMPDMMAAFSSRGPLGDWIKPDVTAPGVQVLAGMTPQPTGSVNGPPGNLYQAIAGTSMSSPHAAGVSALVKAAHPDWTPAEIKSALMTSSVQTVVKEDGVTPATPFDMGAGSIRADRAVNPTLVFDENYEDFVAAGSDPLHRIDLNIASIDAPTMAGEITTMRSAINVSGKTQDLDVSVVAPAGTQIYVSGHKPGPKGAELKSDKKLHADKKKPLDFWVTISAPEADPGQYFGQITLTPKKGTPVVIPVAFVKKQGAVTLTHTCDPTTIATRTGVSHCTATVANFASTEANVSLDVTNLDKGHHLDFTNVAAPASAIKKHDGVTWTGTLSPAIPPSVDSITPASPADTPDGGYLDLSLLGVAPIAGVGDDTITNFNVGTFYYGGEPYSRIGVVSNGYLVIGGGVSNDIVFRPQHFPDAARPNNVLAPLWTDLNPSATGAGSIRIAGLSGGGFSWYVVDWAGVKNFGNATTHSFEVWIQRPSAGAGTGPESEKITFSYGPNLTFPGDGSGLGNAGSGDPDSGVGWGAENRTGTSGVSLATAPADGSEYFVNTSPPTAGGTQSITYDLSSKNAGTYRSVAEMTSDVTAGITQVVQTVDVTH